MRCPIFSCVHSSIAAPAKDSIEMMSIHVSLADESMLVLNRKTIITKENTHCRLRSTGSFSLNCR